ARRDLDVLHPVLALPEIGGDPVAVPDAHRADGLRSFERELDPRSETAAVDALEPGGRELLVLHVLRLVRAALLFRVGRRGRHVGDLQRLGGRRDRKERKQSEGSEQSHGKTHRVIYSSWNGTPNRAAFFYQKRPLND